MRVFPVILIAMLTLSACDSGTTSVDVSQYVHDPQKRTVNVDDHTISVVPTGYHTYIAWGGAEDRNGQIQYRQRRAVELISGCRVSKVASKKTDTVLRATVKC